MIDYLRREKAGELQELQSQKGARISLTATADIPVATYQIQSPAPVPWYKRIFG